jgi:hypothetical protein
MVVHGDAFLRRALQGIAGGHQAGQVVRALPHRLLDRSSDRGRVGQPVAKGHHLRLAQLHVCHDVPLPAAACRQAHGLGNEECSPDATRVVLGPQASRRAGSGRAALTRRASLARRVRGIGDAGLQRLAGLGAIGDAGVEREEHQSRPVEKLRPLVRVDEIARIGLRETWRARREDVLQAVEHLESALRAADVADLAAADEPEVVAGQPGVAECQRQVVVDLLEAQLVAAHALVEVTTDLEDAILLAIERLPYAGLSLRFDAHQRQGARVRAALVDLVHGDVGEERQIGGDPSGGEPAGGRSEQPVIAARDDADQEGRHPVHVPDRIEAFASEVDELSGHAVGCGARDSRICVHDVDHPLNRSAAAPRTGPRRSILDPWGRAGPTRTR